MKRILNLAFLFLSLTLAVPSARAQSKDSSTDRRQLYHWARQMLRHIGPGNTDYRHKDDSVIWGDDNDNDSSWKCYTDCSGFINALIAHAFGFTEADFKNTFGHRRMYAYHYFEAIRSGNHFLEIRNIRDCRIGDLIALEYVDRSEHDDNTGHVMMIESPPVPHRPSKIIEPNTLQYEVIVIDCSRTPHGHADNRYENSFKGLGRGVFRLYTNLQGDIVGYSWSVDNPKEGFDPLKNPVTIGRIEL